MAKFRINKSGVYYYTKAPAGPTGRHVRSEAEEAARLARATCPTDTGTLKSRIQFTARATAKGFSAFVGVLDDSPEPYRRGEKYDRPTSATLLKMIHDGHPSPIFAKGGNLVFIPKGGSQLLRRPSVGGYEANPFVYEACVKAWPYPVRKG